MMRFLAFLGALLLCLAAAQAAPIDNKDGFWSEWSDATFERAAAEKKFVIVSLQSWWCPWCHAMNRDTWANPEVRAVLKDHFIPVAVDQDSRPDISQRYERWGWPATIIFGPDGAEIAKLRGFYSPKFFIPILQETIRDPSPVDYGKLGGPERERTLATGLSDSERAEILAFLNKAYDRANGGWSKSKLVDGPTLGWFLDRAQAERKGAGDKEAEARLKRTLTAQIALIDRESGGISQVSLKPDWSQPSLEFPMFAQQAALSAYARAAVLFDDPTYRAAADRIFGFLKNTLAGPGGGFYASMGMAEGQPGVDKRQYARETGQAIQGLTAYADATGKGSLAATEMAVADYGGKVKGKPVVVISADHQNKPDVGVGIARNWYDNEKVDAIFDVPTSSVALPISALTREKNRININSGGGSSDITGIACSPNTVHWTYDTYSLSNVAGKAMVKRLAATNTAALVAQDRAAVQRAAPQSTGGGSVDLF